MERRPWQLKSAARGVLWSAAVALLLSGCRGCDERPQPPAQGEQRPSGLETITEPSNQRMQALWKEAGGELTLAEAEPAKEMVRYAPPRDCSLGYQLRYLQLSEVAAGREPVGSELMARLVASPVEEAPKSVRWTLPSSSMARIVDGKLSPARRVATQGSAVVTGDGRYWREVEGPHLLWSVSTTQPPLEQTHPSLPALSRVGFEGQWKQRYFPLASAKQLIARRNARRGRKTPNAQPLARIVEVAVGGWITMTGAATPGVPSAAAAASASSARPSASALPASSSASATPSASAPPSAPSASAPPAASSASAAPSGAPSVERAVVIVASWVVEDVTDTPLPHEKLERYKARYVISERGHVVHAIVLGRARHWWSPRPGESNEKRSLSEYELRLTEGCGGVALRAARAGQRTSLDK